MKIGISQQPSTIVLCQCRYTEAEPLYREAIKIATQVLGDNHPHTQTIMENYKTMLSQL